MNVKAVFITQMKDRSFAAPGKVCDHSPVKSVIEIESRRVEDIRAVKFNPLDRLSADVLAERVDDRLDFRKLGHVIGV